MRGGLIPQRSSKGAPVVTWPFASAWMAMEQRLDPTSTAPLAVALSGGGDSLALLHLTLEWARTAGRPVLALTVDHQLHPKSGRWTEDAGTKARALGADWRALVWDGPKPATGLPAAAREARHALLANAAREAGARVLLMGHTLSDIAEGEIMRAADAPGLGRLREWAPSPVWPEGRGVFLLRPLLEVSREALRDDLHTRGETWLDDPANDDLRQSRVRARARAVIGGTPPAMAVSTAPKAFVLAQRMLIGADRTMTASRLDFAVADRAEAAKVLAAALVCASGTARLPRGDALRRALARIGDGDDGVFTLAGCQISLKDKRMHIRRAAPRRGIAPSPPEPAEWIAARFAAACGLISSEAEAGVQAPLTR